MSSALGLAVSALAPSGDIALTVGPAIMVITDFYVRDVHLTSNYKIGGLPDTGLYWACGGEWHRPADAFAAAEVLQPHEVGL